MKFRLVLLFNATFEKSRFSCHAVLDRLDSQSLTVKGEANGANFESGGAKPDPPCSLSRNKSAAAFRKVLPCPAGAAMKFIINVRF